MQNLLGKKLEQVNTYFDIILKCEGGCGNGTEEENMFLILHNCGWPHEDCLWLVGNPKRIEKRRKMEPTYAGQCFLGIAGDWFQDSLLLPSRQIPKSVDAQVPNLALCTHEFCIHRFNHPWGQPTVDCKHDLQLVDPEEVEPKIQGPEYNDRLTLKIWKTKWRIDLWIRKNVVTLSSMLLQ